MEDDMILVEKIEREGSWLFRWRSYLPLLIAPVLIWSLTTPEQLEYVVGDTLEDLYEMLSVVISFFGLAIRCVTVAFVPKGTSGRNTRRQKAACLNTSGIYSLTRNPLYLGNFFIILGIVMFTQSLYAILIVILCYWLYYERIIAAEERFLRERFGSRYDKWAAITPVFFPRFDNYTPPVLSFSIKNVLKREYTALLVIVVSFTVMEVIEDFYAEGSLRIETGWLIFLGVGVMIYLVLRTLKKKTALLDEHGR
jgi:protein-S-isoprenylcysteine O-methyltransferase Ste14